MYKLFDTELDAIEYSHNIAIQYGHGLPESTIQYWYAWRRTADGLWAVQCPEGTEPEPTWEVTEVEL